MMATFRAFAKSPMAIALLGLLIIAFAIWGVSGAFQARIVTWVVKAGSREVDRVDFKRDFDNELRSISQQSGQPVTVQEAVSKGLDRQILQRLATQETLMEALRRNGIDASPKLVIEELRKMPVLFNPVTGKFDERTYQELLRKNEMRDVEFERGLKDQITLAHFSTGVGAGLRAPLTYTAPFAIMNEEQHSADVFQINQRTLTPPAKPTDAQLMALVAKLPKRPETRQISLIRFSAQALAPTLKADPAVVQKRFDSEKARLSVPERRSFVQISVKDARQAADAAQRLSRGEDPAAVAKALGTKPAVYDNTPKGVVPDQRVGDAVFALQPGKVSGPIQGEFGLAVVKLTGITPAKAATIEDVRPQIEAEVRAEDAQNQVYDQVQKYDEAHDSGAPMVQAANVAKVKIYSIGPVAANGQRMSDGQQEPALNGKMLADAFALNQGAETEVIDLGKGEYYAIRVEKINPSAPPSLEEVRPQATLYFMQQQMLEKMRAKADGFIQRLKKGESIEAVAASDGSPVKHLPGVTRANAGAYQQQLGQQLLAQLFQAKTGDVFVGAGPQVGVVVVKVTQVQPGPIERVARVAISLQPQISQATRADVTESVLSAAHNQIKPKINETRAREAIGAQDQAPASGAPAKGSGKAP